MAEVMPPTITGIHICPTHTIAAVRSLARTTRGDYADLTTTLNRVASYHRCDHCGCGMCNCKDLPTPARPGAETVRSPHPEPHRVFPETLLVGR